MSLTLEPQLQNKLDQAAERFGRSADEIASEAIRSRLEELAAQALNEEEQAFQRLYPELRENYLSQYVGIYQGRVVDADADFEELYLRIKRSFEDQTILIRQVNETPDEEYNFRSPRMESLS